MLVDFLKNGRSFFLNYLCKNPRNLRGNSTEIVQIKNSSYAVLMNTLINKFFRSAFILLKKLL